MGENQNLPPYSNTGAVNTLQGGLRALVDWVSFTLTQVHDLQVIYSILKITEGEFIEAKNGNFGYRKMKVSGHILIMYDGKLDMGTHVEMTGQGCREYENYVADWQGLFSRVLEAGGKFTRLDLAVDDFKGYFTVKNLIKKIKKGEAKSKFKKAKRIEQIEIDSGKSEGNTLYLGRPSSRVQIRFYEKSHERKNKGFELEEGVTVWNRTEIQSRDERATALAILIVRDDVIGDIIMGTLKNYINFLQTTDDMNKSRWPISKFWSKFLGDVKALQLSKVAPDRTIERIESWFDRQVEPSLAMLFYAKGLDHIVERIESGLERLNEQDIDIVERYKREFQFYKKNPLERGEEK